MASGTPSNSDATERRLQSLLSASSAFLYEIDPDGIIRYVNRTYPGLTTDDVVGTSLTSWFPESMRPRIEHLLRAALESGNLQETEYTIPDPEGTLRTWSCEMQPTTDADGTPLVVLTSVEITRRVEAETALRYSETLFRTVFEILPVGLWIAGPDGTLQQGNPEGVRIWGAEPHVPQEEYGVFTARRLPSGEEIAPDDWALAQTVNDGATITNELIEIDAFDGEQRVVLNSTAPVLDDAGQSIAAIVVNEDITRLYRTEQELRESRAILQAAFDHSQAGIAIADAPDGRLRYVNEAGLLIRGKTAEEVVNGVTAEEYVESWQILHLDGTPYQTDEVPLARAVRFGETCSEEFIVRRDDEEDRIVWANAAPIRRDDGDVVAGIVVFLDITERKRVDDELRHSEQRLADAQDLARLGHFEWDIETGKVIWSESLYRIYGFGPEDEIDFSTVNERIHHPDDLERITAWLTQCIAAGEGHTSRNEYRLLHKDGTVIDAAVAVRVTRDVTHGTRLFGIVHDISERKRAEAEREQLQRQLVQTQRLESVGRLAGGVAHDFNNMLSIIMGNVDLVEGREDDIERVLSALREIRTAAERSARPDPAAAGIRPSADHRTQDSSGE
jgi:PAS domain S-box-containing protein